MLDVDLVQRLHVVGDERNRHHQDMLATLRRQALQVSCMEGRSHFDAPTLL